MRLALVCFAAIAACSDGGTSGRSSADGGSSLSPDGGGTPRSSATFQNPDRLFATASCPGFNVQTGAGLYNLVVDASRVYAICRNAQAFRFPKNQTPLAAGELTSPTDTSRQMVVLAGNGVRNITRSPAGTAWLSWKGLVYLDDNALTPTTTEGVGYCVNGGGHATFTPTATGDFWVGPEGCDDRWAWLWSPTQSRYVRSAQVTPNTSVVASAGTEDGLFIFARENVGATSSGGLAQWQPVLYKGLTKDATTDGFSLTKSSLGPPDTTMLGESSPTLAVDPTMRSVGGKLYLIFGESKGAHSLAEIDPIAGTLRKIATLVNQPSWDAHGMPLIAGNTGFDGGMSYYWGAAFDGRWLYFGDPGPSNVANMGAFGRIDLTTPGATPEVLASGRGVITGIAVDNANVYWIEHLAGTSGDTTTAGNVDVIFRAGKPPN